MRNRDWDNSPAGKKYQKEYWMKYYEKHKKRLKKRNKISSRKYYETHKDEIQKRHKKYAEEHKEQLAKKSKEWSNKNKEHKAIKAKKWRKKNKNKIKKYMAIYYATNKKYILKRNAEYITERIKTDLNFKLSCSLRARLNIAIKNNQKKGSAVKDLGCTIEFLKQYLENKFYDGMTWENWGSVWELDHIVPLWKFDLTDKKQFKKAINYKNLQPLTVADHRKKTAKERKELAKLRKT